MLELKYKIYLVKYIPKVWNRYIGNKITFIMIQINDKYY